MQTRSKKVYRLPDDRIEIICHQGRHRCNVDKETLNGGLYCSSCTAFFCCSHLRNKYNITKAGCPPDWRCPVCTGICSCSRCLPQRLQEINAKHVDEQVEPEHIMGGAPIANSNPVVTLDSSETDGLEELESATELSTIKEICSSQRDRICVLELELASANKKLQEQRDEISALQHHLATANQKLQRLVDYIKAEATKSIAKLVNSFPYVGGKAARSVSSSSEQGENQKPKH